MLKEPFVWLILLLSFKNFVALTILNSSPFVKFCFKVDGYNFTRHYHNSKFILFCQYFFKNFYKIYVFIINFAENIYDLH